MTALAPPPGRTQDQDRLYDLLSQLSERIGGPRLLAESTGRDLWPSHGVYFFYEAGEQRANGKPRVVRVGTHALTTTSRTTLWQRLSQHRGQMAGRHPGGGNHRGSVFRLHVGVAIIRRDGCADALLRSWLASSADPAWREEEHLIEQAVSTVIRNMPVSCLPVPTRSDGTSDRGLIERGAIALLSGPAGVGDQPSPGWLGAASPDRRIRDAGLWNINHVKERYDPAALDRIAHYVARLAQANH